MLFHVRNTTRISPAIVHALEANVTTLEERSGKGSTRGIGFAEATYDVEVWVRRNAGVRATQMLMVITAPYL